MAFSVLQHRAQDASGNLLTTGVDVRVKHETPGLPLATIYADRVGASTLSNPTVGGFFSDGKVRCYVVGGRFQVELLVGGIVVDTFRDVAAGTMGETDIDAIKAGILLTWDTGTSDADPGPGKIRANNASLASATVLYVDDVNRSGSSIEAFMQSVDDSSSTIKGQIILTDPATEAQTEFNITGAVTNASGYTKIPVAYLSGATSFTSDNPINFQFGRSGDAGSAPGDAQYLVGTANGSLTAERVVTNTVGISWDLGTAAQAKANIITTTQAEQEAGNVSNIAVTGSVQHFHASALKAWGQGSIGGAVSAGYNLGSVTDVDVGKADFNWTTAFNTSAYGVVGTAEASGSSRNITFDSKVAGSVRLISYNITPTPADPSFYYAMAAGDFA